LPKEKLGTLDMICVFFFNVFVLQKKWLEIGITQELCVQFHLDEIYFKIFNIHVDIYYSLLSGQFDWTMTY